MRGSSTLRRRPWRADTRRRTWSSPRTPARSSTAGTWPRFRSIVTRGGLPKFSIYDTRHTYASHSLLMGAPITYVAKQLGHSKPTMTLQAYAHSIPSDDHALAEKLETWRTAQQAAKLVAR